MQSSWRLSLSRNVNVYRGENVWNNTRNLFYLSKIFFAINLRWFVGMPRACSLYLGRKFNTSYSLWWWQEFGDQHFNCLRFHQQEILRFSCFRLSHNLVMKSSLNVMLSQFYPFHMYERIKTISVLSSYRRPSSAEFSFFRRLARRSLQTFLALRTNFKLL